MALRRQAVRLMSAVAFVAGMMAVPEVPALAAGAPFIERPTTPMACDAVAGGWAGRFAGRKEADWGFARYEDKRLTRCFSSEQDCRNWLYNMQSEYTTMVWRADCSRR